MAGANPDYIIALGGTPVFFTINGIPITVTANAGQGKVYGSGPDSALTYSITSGSLVAGDSLTSSLSRAAGENAGSYLITQGTLAASSNYFLTFTPGTRYTITPRSLLVAAEPGQGKDFGAPDPDTLRYFLATGMLVPGDTFSGALSRVTGKNPGTYSILPGTLSASGNYVLSFSPGLFTVGSIPLPPATIPSLPPAKATLPTLDTASFDATRGRNNEDETYYPNALPCTGANIYYSPAKPETSPGSIYSSSSAQELGAK
jgi:hypothetical protein